MFNKNKKISSPTILCMQRKRKRNFKNAGESECTQRKRQELTSSSLVHKCKGHILNMKRGKWLSLNLKIIQE